MAVHEEEKFDIADLIRDIGHGATNKKASERLQEVVKACRLTGKKGSVRIDFAVDSSGPVIEIRASITVKKPEPALPGGAYYATDDGELRLEDPRQTNLPLPKALKSVTVVDFSNKDKDK